MTRIAIDAMGGDFAPQAIVEGAVWGSYDYNVPIELVGAEDKILRELDRIREFITNKSISILLFRYWK